MNAARRTDKEANSPARYPLPPLKNDDVNHNSVDKLHENRTKQQRLQRKLDRPRHDDPYPMPP